MSVREIDPQQEKFLQDMLRLVRKRGIFADGGKVLVAVSGGLDSTVLLHALSRLRRLLNIEIEAAHVDHHTRGASSTQEGVWVRVLAERLQVPCHTLEVVDMPKQNQAELRKARRVLLEKTAGQTGARWIATAHHADDNAETFLMRAISGTGTYGLASISPSNGHWARPLLFATKNDLEEYARAHRLAWVEDPTNARDAYLRNRIRQEVIPTLDGLRQGALRNLARVAERIEDEERAWETWIETQFEGPKESLSLAWLEKWPVPLKRRILRAWVKRVGIEPLPILVEALVNGEELIHGQGSFLKRSDMLIFSPHESFGENLWGSVIPLEVGKRIHMGSSMAWSFLPAAHSIPKVLDLSCYLQFREPKRGKALQMAWEKIPWPLALRSRQKTDSKGIDRLLEAAAIPRPFWRSWPLVVSQEKPERVIAVLGVHVYPEFELKGVGRCVCLESFFEERLSSLSDSC